MILIFGGAYQGKLEYAKENYDIDKYFDCEKCLEGKMPDLSVDAIVNLENFVLKCVDDEMEARDFFIENRDKLQDKVMIMTDVSQGIVPMEARLREFREMNGRLMIYLAKEADEVVRVFCGIGKKVK